MDIPSNIFSGVSGIYCIENTFTNDKYVGSSKNILHRLLTHRAYLRKGIHQNAKLQNSWNKYEEFLFSCYVLETCPEDKLIEREQFYIDSIKPKFNIILNVQEIVISQEAKDKMSKSRKEGFKKGTVRLYQEKPIHQYSLDGVYIQSFKNIKEASKQTQISRSSINRFLGGKYKKGGNYLWSLNKVDSLPGYTKAKKDNRYNNKLIKVTDVVNNTVLYYESITYFSKLIGKNINAVRHAMQNKYPYLKQYLIERV